MEWNGGMENRMERLVRQLQLTHVTVLFNLVCTTRTMCLGLRRGCIRFIILYSLLQLFTDRYLPVLYVARLVPRPPPFLFFGSQYDTQMQNNFVLCPDPVCFSVRNGQVNQISWV